jgi:hypothetical protein
LCSRNFQASRTDEDGLTVMLERDFLKREVEQLRTFLDDMRNERDEWQRQVQTLAIQTQLGQ